MGRQVILCINVFLKYLDNQRSQGLEEEIVLYISYEGYRLVPSGLLVQWHRVAQDPRNMREML